LPFGRAVGKICVAGCKRVGKLPGIHTRLYTGSISMVYLHAVGHSTFLLVIANLYNLLGMFAAGIILNRFFTKQRQGNILRF